jgi:pimeloyl-ACP methyl ester carboxylesterase
MAPKVEEAMATTWDLPATFHFDGQEVRHGAIGDGPPVVLVHGTPFWSHVWHRIAPLLAGRRRVFFFDLLGYGRSEKRAGQDVSLGVQNRVLAALLVHWGLERPDVVAHDFGGATALRAHLLGGRDYRSLTLIDPVAVAPWGSPFVRHVRTHEAAFAGLPAYIHEAILGAYLRGAVRRAIPDGELRPYVEPWLGAEGQAAFYRQIAQMDQRHTDEVEPRYGEIRCPVQILWGEDDAWIPLERGRHLASLIPGARFRPVPRAGHLVQEDAPEAVVAALLEFLPEAGR